MKKQKVAIICAHPAGTNLGMISVDAATHSLEKQFKDTEFVRFSSWRSLSKGKLLNYKHYYDQTQLTEFDHIIFWGDFLHWIGYANNDWLIKSKKMNLNLTDNEIIDLWYSLYLLENREDLQKKCILFGGTIYGLNSSQLADNRYKTGLTSLLNNSILVKTRDILSANFVSQLVPSKKDSFGCDCSLILDNYYFTSDVVDKSSEPYFLYSFSRSGKKEELIEFVKITEKHFGIKGIYIPWIEKGANINSLERSIKLITNSKFVLTDIYHLTLNSWREGIPAICVGNGNSIITDTLSDKKKEIFYQQIFASNYFLFVEDILKDYSLAAKQVVSCVNDTISKEIIVHYLKKHAQHTLDDLVNTLVIK